MFASAFFPAILFSYEGKVEIYRENELLELKENLPLLKNDIICTTEGKALIYYKTAGYFGLFKENCVRGDNPYELRILNDKLVEQLRQKKASIEASFSGGLMVPNYQVGERKINFNLVLILDVSTSMRKFFKEIQIFIDEKIIQNSLIDGDYIYFYTFGERIRQRVKEKLTISGNQTLLSSLIHSIAPDEKATDIGQALDELDGCLEQKFPYRKSFVFFITDGKNDPPDDSPYIEKDIYKEDSFDTYKKMRDGNYKVMLLGIGEETAAKDLSRPLGGEYIEVSSEFTAQELSSLINDLVGDIEMITPSDLGSIDRMDFPIKLAFLSSYQTAKKIDPLSIEYSVDNGNKIQLNPFSESVLVEANQQVLKEIAFELPAGITEGKHSIQFKVNSENISIANSGQEIIFTYTPFPWFIIIVIILVFIIGVGAFIFIRRNY